MLGPFFIK